MSPSQRGLGCWVGRPRTLCSLPSVVPKLQLAPRLWELPLSWECGREHGSLLSCCPLCAPTSTFWSPESPRGHLGGQGPALCPECCLPLYVARSCYVPLSQLPGRRAPSEDGGFTSLPAPPACGPEKARWVVPRGVGVCTTLRTCDPHPRLPQTHTLSLEPSARFPCLWSAAPPKPLELGQGESRTWGLMGGSQ